MTEIRHIVFDLGNVLLNWDPDVPFRRLIPDEAERKRFLTEICSGAWNLEQDRGRSWEDAADVLVAEHPEHEALIRAYRRHWPEMLTGSIEESVAILEALVDDGHDVTALSNWAADTFAETKSQFPFLDRFRGVTVSAHVGMVKPDLAIYRHHADEFGLTPAATLFIDDNPHNVEAAREAGWKAERFVSPAGLRADLARHGIRLA